MPETEGVPVPLRLPDSLSVCDGDGEALVLGELVSLLDCEDELVWVCVADMDTDGEVVADADGEALGVADALGVLVEVRVADWLDEVDPDTVCDWEPVVDALAEALCVCDGEPDID